MSGRALLIIFVAPFVLTLAGCASGPETIAADDEAYCRYAVAAAPDNFSDGRCRARLASYHAQALAMNASVIQDYALLRAPGTPSGIAGQCKGGSGGQPCSMDDVTGTIPIPPKKP